MRQLCEKSGFIQLSYTQIFYQMFFTPATQDRMPLVVIAGGPGSTYDYLLSLKQVAYDRPVIFYNQSGCGNSVVQGCDSVYSKNIVWTVQHYCQELKQLLDIWGYQQYHIFGHSWGGTLAIAYALQDVLPIKSLLLASPYVRYEQYVQDVRRLIRSISSELYDNLVQREQQNTTNTYEYIGMMCMVYEHFFCRLSYWPYELIQSMLTINNEIYTTMWSRYELRITGNLKNINYIPELQKITVPALITCGRFDVITPESMHIVHKLIKNSELLVFENSSHVPHLEEESLYVSSIKNFLDKHDMLSK